MKSFLRRIVVIVFVTPAKLDIIVELRHVLEVVNPNTILIPNTTDQGSSMVGEAYSLRLNNLQFRMDRLLRKVAVLWSCIPT